MAGKKGCSHANREQRAYRIGGFLSFWERAPNGHSTRVCEYPALSTLQGLSPRPLPGFPKSPHLQFPSLEVLRVTPWLKFQGCCVQEASHALLLRPVRLCHLQTPCPPQLQASLASTELTCLTDSWALGKLQRPHPCPASGPPFFNSNYSGEHTGRGVKTQTPAQSCPLWASKQVCLRAPLLFLSFQTIDWVSPRA